MNKLRQKYFTIISRKHANAACQIQSNTNLLENCKEVKNRNPRNLESLTIERKPVGYHLDMPGHEYWNKLNINVTLRHVIATITHFKNGPVVSASTQEWAFRKQLVRTKDVAAFSNLGKVLAQRCLESGISAVYCDLDTTNSQKYKLFIESFTRNGIVLEEPPVYKNPTPWDWKRPVKPWMIDE